MAVVDGAEGCHTAHEATLKIRCSTGLRVQQIYGAGCSLSKDELNHFLGARRDDVLRRSWRDSSILRPGNGFMSSARLLYSDPATQRRLVRVHNVALRVVAKPSEHYKTVCVETAFSSLVRSALVSSGLCRALYVHDDLADPGKMQISGDALKKARDVLQTTCVEALYEYRVACAARSPPGQLILPESIKLLPLLVLGAFKGVLLRSSSPQAPGADACERAATLELAMAAHPAWLCRAALVRGYLFPREAGVEPDPGVGVGLCTSISTGLRVALVCSYRGRRGPTHGQRLGYHAARRRLAIACRE